MGRYLAIGLKTELAISKKNAEKAFHTVQEAINTVKKELASEEAYDMIEVEDFICFKLKPKLLETELVSFLHEFYTIRYGDISKSAGHNKILSDLQKCNSASEIMSLADEKRFEDFQKDEYWENVLLDGGRWDSLTVYTQGIDLSLDGKIVMEFYGSLFRFLTSLIQERLGHYKLAKALHVTITG